MRFSAYLLAAIAGTGVVALGIMAGVAGFSDTASDARADSRRMVLDALTGLDARRIEVLVAAGWDPNEAVDGEGNSAIHYALRACGPPGAARQDRLLHLVQVLYNSGNRLDLRNARGETPYSLARAERACGPGHPVTEMIRRQCFEGYRPAGDACVAGTETGARGVPLRNAALRDGPETLRKI